MFDLDEGFHALQNLDARGRMALVLAGKLWKEIYRDEGQHRPATLLVSRYLAELSELSKEVHELRRLLDDALDSREQAEIRAEQAEALLEKERRKHYLHHREPHLLPPCAHCENDRIDRLSAEVQLLRRQLRAVRGAEYEAVRKLKQERDNAWAEVGRLRAHLDF